MDSFVGRSFDMTELKERYKRKMIITGAVIAGILVCIMIFILVYQWFINRKYDSYKVVSSSTIKEGESMEYVSYDGGILRYGRDGVTAVNKKGDTIWSGSYEMANPRVDICGKSVVIADVGEKDVYVYRDGEDSGVEFTVDYPILQACVSGQGVTAVLTEEDSSNNISLYNPFDKSEKLLAEIPTNVEDGYPVSMDLSKDGNSVVAAYACVTTGVVQSRVAFYNFSSAGKNTNCLVGAHNYNSSLISEVQFTDDDNVCLFAEGDFYVWGNMKKPKLSYHKKIDKKIQSAFVGEGKVGMILEKDDKLSEMKVYDNAGSEVLSKNVKNGFTHAEICEGEIILYSGTYCQIYKMNGICKFKNAPKGKITCLISSSSYNRYFIVQDSKLKLIKLK